MICNLRGKVMDQTESPKLRKINDMDIGTISHGQKNSTLIAQNWSFMYKVQLIIIIVNNQKRDNNYKHNMSPETGPNRHPVTLHMSIVV